MQVPESAIDGVTLSTAPVNPSKIPTLISSGFLQNHFLQNNHKKKKNKKTYCIR